MPIKPSDAEQEYFLKHEIDKLRKARHEADAKMKAAEKKKAKDLHFMKCPKCGADLGEIEYRGIKVDYCGGCGGTWFDKGEVTQLLALDEKEHFLGKMLKVFSGK
jgi:hypothetical protein